MLADLIEWTRGQNQSTHTEYGRYCLGYALNGAETALSEAEHQLVEFGFAKPAPTLSRASSQLKFKDPAVRPRHATGGSGGPTINHPPTAPGHGQGRPRSGSAPPYQTFNPASPVAVQGMGTNPTLQPAPRPVQTAPPIHPSLLNPAAQLYQTTPVRPGSKKHSIHSDPIRQPLVPAT
jgi:hypothetical protein